MNKPNHSAAYVSPWDNAKDNPFTSHIAEVLHKWFRARNGQNEQLRTEFQWGVDKTNNRAMVLVIRTVVVPPGTIG